MNRVELMGRLTREPETRYNNDLAISRYTLAVNRMKKGEADFINIVAFGKAGEFAGKYFHKGMQVAVCGRIQTGSYTNTEGRKIYTTDVIAESQEFAESKRELSKEFTPTEEPLPEAFEVEQVQLDADLPF